MKQTISTFWKIDESDIPVKIIYENRDSARFSTGVKNFIIRIPAYYPESDKSNLLNQAKDWATSVLREEGRITERYSHKIYAHGQKINCFDRSYTFIMAEGDNTTVFLNVKDAQVVVRGYGVKGEVNGSLISNALQKLFSKVYLGPITGKTFELSMRTGLPVPEKVKLKYMTSRWGSCSARTNNVNVNTRLILAPEEVLNSVIIHELCHLRVPNHSSDFWALLKKCDPDYKSHQEWLKTNGHQLKL